MMTYDEFRDYVKDNIKFALPDRYADAEVSVNEVTKNNDSHFYGLSIRESDSNISPTIYLESFYEDYTNGKDLADVIERIAEIREQNAVRDVDLTSLLDLEQQRDKISCRLVNIENNKDYLSDRPYTKMNDLAVIYQIEISNSEIGSGSVVISNQLLSELGISKEELHEIAMENLSKQKLTFQSMQEILSEMMPGFGEDMGMPPMMEPAMYVISNENKVNGAVAVLNMKFMEEISQKLGGDLVIIPSSIHEQIILPKTPDMDMSQIDEMIKEVNATEVRPEERLSDHVYIYDAETKEIVRADKEENMEHTENEVKAQNEEKVMDSMIYENAANSEPVGVSEGAGGYSTKEMISITFAKGLVGEPFLGKDGNGYREVKIPNIDPNDKQPWQSFVLRNDQIHQNENGKSVWCRMTKDGETTVKRNVRVGVDENGKGVYEAQTEKMKNVEIKGMLENYRNQSREAEHTEQEMPGDIISAEELFVNDSGKDSSEKYGKTEKAEKIEKSADKPKKTSIKDTIAKKKEQISKNVKEAPAQTKNREAALA